ncbi:YdcF family protein [Gordonia sp. DT30]|uniref:YdcF family protein n=1 Tax=Gordonia sp. DT30 TaxID=3416546 RepID=UPI003CF2CB40
MSRVKRNFRRTAVGVLALSAIGGAAVGTLPTSHESAVTTAAVTVDPASLYNAAQQKFAAGDVAGGLGDLKQAVTLNPADSQSLALQAIWADQISDDALGKAALNRLTVVDSRLAKTTRNVIDGVTKAAAIVPSTTARPVSGNPAIVILGFGLSPEGKPAPELIKRLEAGRAQALSSPSAPIVVTGGKPQNGATEASVMRKWLIANGVAPARIATEETSVSTVSNAQNTAGLLTARHISDVVLVTSPNHIRRAAADFAAAGLTVTQSITTDTDLAKNDAPLPKDKQTGIRVEATRTAGIPTSRTPLLPTDQLPGSQLPDVGPGIIDDIGGKILGQLVGSGSAG